MLNDLLGRIIYEAVETGGAPWEQIDNARWIAAGLAVASKFETHNYYFVVHPEDPALKFVPDGTTVIFQR